MPVTESGAVRLLYLCFFKRSRDYLRGFLIAAWAGAEIAGRSGSGKTHFSTFTHAMLSTSSDSHENK